jgi:hypothetical protein
MADLRSLAMVLYLVEQPPSPAGNRWNGFYTHKTDRNHADL